MRRAVLLLAVTGTAVLLAAGVALAQTTTPTTPQSKGDQTEDPVPSEDVIPGEILVKFESGASKVKKQEVHEKKGGKTKEIISGVDIEVVAVDRGKEKAKAKDYQNEPNVEYAEPNLVRRADYDSNDSRDGEQWQYNNTGYDKTGAVSGKSDADIDAYEAWDTARGDASVSIAILDSGISDSHPDLQGRVRQSANCMTTTSDGKCVRASVNDVAGHGTHVAGIAGAATNNGAGVAGTCPDCALLDVKVLNDSGSGSSSSMIKGLRWAVDDPDGDSNTKDGAKVINMSLGGGSYSQSEQDAVTYAWNKGAVVAASAGNNKTSKAHYPSDYTNIIGVAATNNIDDRYWWTNYGTKVEVAAPGQSILSTTNDGAYGTKSGTSMASPHVAGLAGLVWSTSYGTTNQNVRNRILATADPISGTGRYWSNGRINACRAVGGVCTYTLGA